MERKQMYVAVIVNICNIDIIFIVITEILIEHRTFPAFSAICDLGLGSYVKH